MGVGPGLSRRQLALRDGLSPNAVSAIASRGSGHPETLKKKPTSSASGLRSSFKGTSKPALTGVLQTFPNRYLLFVKNPVSCASVC